MAKSKAAAPRYMQYPKEQALRVGIKVSWHYYAKEEHAKAASKAAVHNAALLWNEGYDFGYQSPGAIRPPRNDHTGEWAQYNGLWEVCTP